MRRILFVDDEPRILEALENLMFDLSDDWDMEFADNGPDALSLLDQENFDVLVTDMRMPGMDGSELLQRVKAAKPSVVRLVLSGHSDVGAARRAMPIAHQFLSKPCSSAVLTRVLDRAAAVYDLLDNEEVRSLVGNITSLPARPAIYSKLMTLFDDDDWSLAQVAATVEQDVAIATKLLQVANTAFFSRSDRRITSVREAVSRIGATYVSELVFSFETYRSFGQAAAFDIDGMHQQGLEVGKIATKIAPADMSDVFLAGLVHDIGRLVLAASFPDKFGALERRIADENLERTATEKQVFGASHAEAGAYFVGLWGMSYDVIEAAGFHHRPDRLCRERPSAAGAVYLALALQTSIRTGRDVGDDVHEYLRDIGAAHQLRRWHSAAERIICDGSES